MNVKLLAQALDPLWWDFKKTTHIYRQELGSDLDVVLLV